MTDAVDAEVHELVIIKHRGGHDEEAHHGGVWKIAYADFMTAMMAFFLVLWLLNSTNKEAKISIKNYFNPVKLADASMTRKGIIDPKDAQPGAAPTMGQKAKSDEPGDRHGDNGIFPQSNGPDSKKAKSAEPGGPPDAEAPGGGSKPAPDAKPEGGAPGQAPGPSSQGGPAGDAGAATYSESALFQDPYRILTEIAAKGQPPAAGANPDKPGGGAVPAYRDPFTSTPPTMPPAPAAAPAGAPNMAAPAAPAPSPAAAVPPAHPGPPAPVAQLAESGKGASGETKSEAAKLQADMTKSLGEVMAGQPGPKMEVKATSEGVLVSLTDDLDFGMFSIGSAQPQAKLVKIMEKIAGLLKTRPGAIVIRGHTDARPYKSKVYDNWRLSSDRAQMAHYMLVRGGLDEKRFAAVEGHADREPKVPADPMAAANRRIEILLRKESP